MSRASRAATLVAQSPDAQGWSFDPVRLVRAVNALHALGKRGALDVLQALAADGRVEAARVMLNLELLCVPSAVARIGNPFGRADVVLPSDNPSFDRLPLFVSNALPFLLAGGFRQSGRSLPPGVVLAGLSADDVRDAPLHPGAAPHVALQAFFASTAWRALAACQRNAVIAQRLKCMLMGQALRASGCNGPGEAGCERLGRLSGADVDSEWEAASKALEPLQLAWCARRQAYAAA